VASFAVKSPRADAELHVINTCCITGEAEAKSRLVVRRSHRSAKSVHVSGCAVNLNRRQFDEIGARVTPFVGTAERAVSSPRPDAWSCRRTG
jgi:threonylcarbamoyladenosine tRNA methylthiotransferase MtaB